jgi:uncharacterized protein (TIRG00374 family)
MLIFGACFVPDTVNNRPISSIDTKAKQSPVKKLFQYGISIAVLGAAIWYLAANIDFASVYDHLTDLRWGWVLLVVPIVMISHVLRTIRWGTMLEPIKTGMSRFNMFSAVMVGYFANNVIPIPRAGEFLRPYALSRREKISFSSLFATIILERLLDVLFLLLMFGISFAIISDKIMRVFPTDSISPGAILTIIGLFIVVVLLAFYPPLFEGFLHKVVKPITGSKFEKILGIYDKFKDGFSIVRTPSRYLKLFIESILIWLVYAVPLYILFFAFPGLDSYGLNFGDSIFLLVVAGVSVTVAPTPGALGIYHILVQTALVELYGIPGDLALAYATVAHAISKATEIIFGAVFFSRENIKGVPSEAEMEREMG